MAAITTHTTNAVCHQSDSSVDAKLTLAYIATSTHHLSPHIHTLTSAHLTLLVPHHTRTTPHPHPHHTTPHTTPHLTSPHLTSPPQLTTLTTPSPHLSSPHLHLTTPSWHHTLTTPHPRHTLTSPHHTHTLTSLHLTTPSPSMCSSSVLHCTLVQVTRLSCIHILEGTNEGVYDKHCCAV